MTNLLWLANASLTCVEDAKTILPMIDQNLSVVHPDLNEHGYVKTPTAVSFTGHRPERLGGYDEELPLIQEVKKHLRNVITIFNKLGYKTFISGAALGVDQWAAEAVIEAKLNLILAIPHKGYGDNWPDFSQRRLVEIQKHANSVYVCEGGYSKEKTHLRNLFMIHNSKHVIAVWDGNRDGGTASAVRHARKEGRKIFNFNPITKKVGWLDE